MKITYSLISLLLLFSVSCSANQDKIQKVVVGMGDLGKDDFYYVKPDYERRLFLINISRISLGDTVDKVVLIMGIPSYDQVMIKKENRKILGRDLKYYFRIYEKNLVNEKHDRLVSFWFNEENKLLEITTNVEEILELKLSNIKRFLE